VLASRLCGLVMRGLSMMGILRGLGIALAFSRGRARRLMVRILRGLGIALAFGGGRARRLLLVRLLLVGFRLSSGTTMAGLMSRFKMRCMGASWSWACSGAIVLTLAAVLLVLIISASEEVRGVDRKRNLGIIRGCKVLEKVQGRDVLN